MRRDLAPHHARTSAIFRCGRVVTCAIRSLANPIRLPRPFPPTLLLVHRASARRDHTARARARALPRFPRAQKNHAEAARPTAIRTSCPTTSGTTSGRASRGSTRTRTTRWAAAAATATPCTCRARARWPSARARAAAGGGVQAVRRVRPVPRRRLRHVQELPRQAAVRRAGRQEEACVARACVRAQQQADDVDDQSEEDAASAHDSEPSTVHEISPAILATDGESSQSGQHQRPADDDAAPRGGGPQPAPAPRPRARCRRPSSAGELASDALLAPFQDRLPVPFTLVASHDCGLS